MESCRYESQGEGPNTIPDKPHHLDLLPGWGEVHGELKGRVCTINAFELVRPRMNWKHPTHGLH